MPEHVSSLTRKLMTLLALPRVGQQTVRKLLQYPQFSETKDLTRLGFLDPRLYQALEVSGALDLAGEHVETELQRCAALGVQVVGVLDDAFPALLRNHPAVPLVLYVQGTWQACPALAVVGTRTPTLHGVLTVQRITGHFVQQGFGTVSALVPGCAALAHQTALELGGWTVAVLAAGHDQALAPALSKLQQDIVASGGAVVSPFPPGTVLRNHQQKQRDVLLALLGHGLLLVQSGLDGTALHPMRIALEAHRPVAVPALSQTDLQQATDVTAVNRLLLKMPADLHLLLEIQEGWLKDLVLLHHRQDYPRFKARLHGFTPAAP